MLRHQKTSFPSGHALNEPTVPAAAICNKGGTVAHMCAAHKPASLSTYFEEQQQEEEVRSSHSSWNQKIDMPGVMFHFAL